MTPLSIDLAMRMNMKMWDVVSARAKKRDSPENTIDGEHFSGLETPGLVRNLVKHIRRYRRRMCSQQ